ncbi:MAG: hypothetical protein B7733_05360 [Myxococcales bacterium FL481]|nr:MAG: hypothetical protein B7733_05360 [Myxococcales bacterium FL481]
MVTVVAAQAGPEGWLACASWPSLRDMDDAIDLRQRADWGQDDGRPRYLVCTHGKRDRCCARLGVPAYTELQRLAGERALQTSHLGGHRFAPAILVLPHGYLYGRVPPERCGEIFAAHERGEVGPLEWLRGRVDLRCADQLAEIVVRRELGAMGLRDATHLDGVFDEAAGTWRSTWATATERFVVGLKRERHRLAVLKSCDDPEPVAVERWTAMSWGRL